MNKGKLKIFINFGILISLVTFYIILYSPVHAQTMSNGNYILEQGTFDSFAGQAEGPAAKVSFSSGETGSGVYTGTNYTVRSGFEFFNSSQNSQPFIFSLSGNSISFGNLTAGEPVVRTSILTISNPSSGGYQVLASENNSLTSSGTIQIPDTTCDTGNCTESVSGIWSSPLTYGFGYRCDNLEGTDCSTDFNPDLTYFKSFANVAQNESAQAVMSSAKSNNEIQSQISYRINIAGTQTAGTYQNTIQYIAIPSL